jgi:peptidoglycan/LPS O-acetylase OafA/YrhL
MEIAQIEMTTTADLIVHNSLATREKASSSASELGESEQYLHAPVHARLERLDGLTSLRFFAASMILMLHVNQLFGSNIQGYFNDIALWQGVSFFFVLSGFILSYVYPQITTSRQSNDFLLARFARVWPTHFAAFILTLLLVPDVLKISNLLPVTLANLSMVHVWIFNPSISQSFNSVSWTISIEWFFYLAFPFLIKDFDQRFKFRWLLAIACSLPMIFLCMVPHLIGASPSLIPTALYLGENPLCRLSEFTLGIITCWIFRKYQSPMLSMWSEAQATFCEIIALGLIGLAVSLSILWPAQNLSSQMLVIRAWAIDFGGAPAYAFLIFLVATERGHIAQFLKRKSLVGLGEISFSLYMIHLSLLYALTKYQGSFSNLPGWLLPTIGVLACLILSHLNFTFIETPARKAILNLARRSKLTSTQKTLKNQANGKIFHRRLFLLTEACVLLLIFVGVQSQFRFISPATAQRIEAHSLPTVRNIDFGGKFLLRGLKLSRKSDGLYLQAIWQSLNSQKLNHLNAIQLIDAHGKTLSTKVLPQDSFGRAVSPEKIWEDKIFLPQAQLKNALRIGLSIYEPVDGQPLLLTRGCTDGGNSRLLLAVP